ncbi:SpiroCoCo family coiled-coil protein [Leadbettera azotonutricia]|uniref:Uncharacterized protein n=1 Tax=Leadbettera azotonutricia (strain ATCC BAA-888 / DSM 13862 / ZAS-9) TaxID=545695 RepID=F5Y9T5_LEAAZ|nr:hypothetical protein [Leadbettera azotonutricia]AEF83094.1 hypothetical protein TREAZ_3185 [Leadbettera azotonutricia ZAS-9]
MGFFTVGNLLTLGIVALVLILYRQLDRRGRSLDKLSKFAEKIKTEFRAFTDEQGEAVSGYRAELKVEQEAAKVLMDRIKTTNEELAEKSAAVARLEERLKTYESSMEELSGMTGRVQENLNRIRDESAFVEGAARRVTEAKSGLEDLENGLQSLEIRFERDNAESLEKTAESVIAAVRSAVSDLEANAETIERQVDEHRDAVNKIEQERAASLARDMDIVNRTLKTAVEQAGLRADRMEEAALVKLKEQAQERIRRLQAAEEERLKTYQESAKNRVAESQGLVKTFREEWRTERQEWETRDKALRDEWKKDLQEMKNAVADQEAQLVKVSEEMKRKALEVTGARLEEYRQAQDGEFRRLEALTEDSRKLDAELRRSMQEVTAKVRDEFILFETESDNARKAAAEEFSSAAAALRQDMEGVEKELNSLKNQAYQNVSEKLQVFEDDFFADLARRSGDIERRLSEWQDNLETKLKALGEDAETRRQDLETKLSEDMKKTLDAQTGKLLSDLERLKIESGAFEESIRGRMNAADDSLASYKAELDHNLEDARESAELTIKAEIGNYALTTAETIKQNQRELEGKFRDISGYVENRNTELSGIIDASRQSISGLDSRIAAVRSSIEEAYQDADSRRSEIVARAEEQAKTLDAEVKDAERHIKEFFDQTKLIDQANELKIDMERRIEDLRGDINRLDQRRSEAAQLESQFVKIRRLEDEVNAKMTRFLSEKHRIEQMDADFSRLIQISRAVEEKLTQVTASDDILQQMQVQIRKLEESLEDAEEKYQRIEKKNQTLDMTADGIASNFKALQESEKAIEKIQSDLSRLGSDHESLKNSIEALAGESEKARETADEISVLDEALAEIREKTNALQKAREWIAQSETRLEVLNKQVQTNLKIMEGVINGKGGDPLGTGAPSIGKRESIIALARQSWTVEQIAKTLKISQGEVELTLETFNKE